jgi:hypothetical protein
LDRPDGSAPFPCAFFFLPPFCCFFAGRSLKDRADIMIGREPPRPAGAAEDAGFEAGELGGTAATAGASPPARQARLSRHFELPIALVRAIATDITRKRVERAPLSALLPPTHQRSASEKKREDDGGWMIGGNNWILRIVNSA